MLNMILRNHDGTELKIKRKIKIKKLKIIEKIKKILPALTNGTLTCTPQQEKFRLTTLPALGSLLGTGVGISYYFSFLVSNTNLRPTA